jgi:hypothetical protein
MNKYVSIIFKHWQTSLIGLLILVMTLMLWLQRINITEWATAIGVILTLWAAVSKDANKTQSKE